MKAWRFTLSDKGKYYFGITFADTEEEAKESIQNSIKCNLKIEYIYEADLSKDNIYIAGGVFPTSHFKDDEINDIFK